MNKLKEGGRNTVVEGQLWLGLSGWIWLTLLLGDQKVHKYIIGYMAAKNGTQIFFYMRLC